VEAVTGPLLPWDGPDVELIVHDAHIPGHTAAWIPALGLLIAGDMLSDIELPLPDTEQPRANQHAESPGATRDPLESYLEGLDRLGPYVNRANLVIPGHGTPTADGLARLDADRRYLDAVRAGRRCDDARIAHPGMDAAHRTTVALATGGC
jgi:glyoxylase-like metal-dependent hydrolase (beta-lactamase superfamily II)